MLKQESVLKKVVTAPLRHRSSGAERGINRKSILIKIEVLPPPHTHTHRRLDI